MKRNILLVAFVVFLFTGGLMISYAQQESEPARAIKGYPIITPEGKEWEMEYKATAKQKIATVLLEDFEEPGEWTAQVSRDFGTVSIMTREGAPKALKALGEKNKYVLGIKALFYRRGPAVITIKPIREIKIPGITKYIKVWVVGRNYRHTLKILVRDFLGQLHEVTVGQLTHIGWKQMEVYIPEQIPQENYKLAEERGLTFEGFVIYCDMTDIVPGRPFYIYFDYLTADTDLFVEYHRDVDDMIDNW